MHLLSILVVGHGTVAVDECHEMLINKLSVIRPSHEYINRMIHYLPGRTKATENLNKQLFPVKSDTNKGKVVTKNPSMRKISQSSRETQAF